MSLWKANSNNSADLIAGTNEVVSGTSNNTSSSLPLGSSIIFYGLEENIPNDWMREDGRSLNKNEYLDLFNVIGYTYGGSDNIFNIPDSRGKVIVHVNEADEEFNVLGKTYGEKEHQLTTNEMPSHTHTKGTQEITGSFQARNTASMNSVATYPNIGDSETNAFSFTYEGGDRWSNSAGSVANEWGNNAAVNFNASKTWTGESSSEGNDQPHNNIQPSISAFRIIKVKYDPYTKDVRDLDEKIKQLELIVNRLDSNLGDLEIEIVDEWEE